MTPILEKRLFLNPQKSHVPNVPFPSRTEKQGSSKKKLRTSGNCDFTFLKRKMRTFKDLHKNVGEGSVISLKNIHE